MEKARSQASDVSRREFLLRTLAVVGGAATAAPTARPGKEVELIVWANFNEIHRYIVDLAPKYTQQNPNIKINCTLFAQRALDEKVAVALPAGQGPDIIDFASTQVLPYIQYVQFAPPDAVDFVKKNMPEAAFRECSTAKGELHTFPFYVVTSALFYNTEHFAEAGLKEPPKDLDELAEYAKKLTKRDPRGNITRSGLDLRVAGGGFGLTEKFWVLAMEPNGIHVIDQVGDKWKAGYDNEAGRKALQFYVDGLYKHKYCAIDMKHDAEAFGLGVASMFCRESWVVDYLAKNAPNLKYGVALQPRGAKDWCTIAATRGFAVPKVSKNQEEAWKFIQWLVNDENCGTFFKNYSWQPWRTNVDYSAAYKARPALKAFQDGLKTQGYRLYPYPQTPPAIEIYARMADRLAAAFKRADLVDNPKGVAQVMSDMAKETNQILADNNVLAK